MKTFKITFKDRNKWEDVTLQASQMNNTDHFLYFVTFGVGDEYSTVGYALSEVFRVEECA